MIQYTMLGYNKRNSAAVHEGGEPEQACPGKKRGQHIDIGIGNGLPGGGEGVCIRPQIEGNKGHGFRDLKYRQVVFRRRFFVKDANVMAPCEYGKCQVASDTFQTAYIFIKRPDNYPYSQKNYPELKRSC